MKTLYKKDILKRIRVWNIWTEGDILAQTAGILDGKLVLNSKVCTPKNVGKSNGTTGEMQAAIELISSYQSKLDEGYFPTIKEAEEELVLLPMLAKTYSDHKHKIDWSNCFAQPKLDGMRCLASIKNGIVTLISRDGKIIENMQHIIDELKHIKSDVVLDGELYAIGKNFQENMRLIKKYRPGETEQIHYHVYDCVSETKFLNRLEFAHSLIRGMKSIEPVRTLKIISENELKDFHALNISNGYEGSIVRWSDNPYKIDGRSENLLKYKDFQDIALPIIDIIPSVQRPTWGQPIFELNSKKFSAGTRLSHSEKEEFLINKSHYIGKTAEIRFFEFSDEGIPRFPIFCGIRLDK